MTLGIAEKTWLTLVGLTLTSAWLAETGHAGLPLTLMVAALIAFKGRMVIDRYMEMTTANRRIRRVLYVFITLVPTLVILSYYFSDALARLSTIG